MTATLPVLAACPLLCGYVLFFSAAGYRIMWLLVTA